MSTDKTDTVKLEKLQPLPMKILIEQELLLKILSALKAYGKEATAATEAKLQTAIDAAETPSHLEAALRAIHGHAKSIKEARILAFDALSPRPTHEST